MAAPFALEDLKKLQTFIEFVASKPSILNLPQLDFLKKLIEKFGGKVPEGDFEMPAGGKCPFGGDVKSETKSAPTPAAEAEPEEDEKEPEVEEESEESEVELDMEADNVTLFEPNVLYLDEKPPTVVKSETRTASLNKKHTKKKAAKKTLTKSRNKSKKSVKKSKFLQEYIVKHELSLNEDQQVKVETQGNVDPNDPLYEDPLIEVKCELTEDNGDDAKMEALDEEELEDFDPNYFPDNRCYDPDDDDADDDEAFDNDDFEPFERKYKINQDSEEDDDDEDEPLIRLTRSKGQPKKYPIKSEDGGKKIKAPRSVKCNVLCKQHCFEKFTKEQRNLICDFYWKQSKADRLTFIRKHTKSRRSTKKRKHGNKRGSNCCYYLSDPAQNQSTEGSNDITRVCRKFFEATLLVSNHYIKKALDGYKLELEKDKEIMDIINTNLECKAQEKSNEIKQILDPATGNLITIDPNDKTKHKKTVSSELKPKYKRVRRKPGDPLPEHTPKPIKCSVRCIHKCHTKFTEPERKQMCDIFWSMDFKRRKDFILASIEVKEIETEVTPEFRKTNRPPRAYHTRFFMRTGLHGENKRVCKHFLTSTLCTNRTFISNAIEFADKTTGYYTGVDRRGHHPSSNKISPERKQYILDHVSSYPTWVPNKKSKIKYLHYSLSIKKMFDEYKEKCLMENEKPVSSHYYYKSFHDDFRLLFLTTPEPKKGGGFLNLNPNLSHYTGQEPGGFWQDSKGEKLDIRFFNPAQSMSQPSSQQQHAAVNAPDFPIQPNPLLNYATTSAANQSFDLIDASSSKAVICQQPSSLFRFDLNPNLYDNLPHSSTSMFKKP